MGDVAREAHLVRGDDHRHAGGRQLADDVEDLADELGVGQASVSKHLNVLRQVGILSVRREGTQSFYAVRDESIFELCKLVCDGVVRHVQAEHAALGIEQSRRPAKRARR